MDANVQQQEVTPVELASVDHPLVPELVARLNDLDISTTTYRHEALFTVEQSRHVHEQVHGAHTKNLFLKDKKGKVFLLTAREDTQIPLNHVHKALGCGRLSFGKGELMEELIGVTPGSVTALAIMQDHDAGVRMLIDGAILQHKTICAHPMTNTATTQIARDDLLAFFEACDHTPDVLFFGEAEPEHGIVAMPLAQALERVGEPTLA